jgi:hypothetical protein
LILYYVENFDNALRMVETSSEAVLRCEIGNNLCPQCDNVVAGSLVAQ